MSDIKIKSLFPSSRNSPSQSASFDPSATVQSSVFDQHSADSAISRDFSTVHSAGQEYIQTLQVGNFSPNKMSTFEKVKGGQFSPTAVAQNTRHPDRILIFALSIISLFIINLFVMPNSRTLMSFSFFVPFPFFRFFFLFPFSVLCLFPHTFGNPSYT